MKFCFGSENGVKIISLRNTVSNTVADTAWDTFVFQNCIWWCYVFPAQQASFVNYESLGFGHYQQLLYRFTGDDGPIFFFNLNYPFSGWSLDGVERVVSLQSDMWRRHPGAAAVVSASPAWRSTLSGWHHRDQHVQPATVRQWVATVWLLGGSGRVVNSLVFYPASVKSLGCFTSGVCCLHNGRQWQWLGEVYIASFKGIFEGP